jgi:hypothetical protein
MALQSNGPISLSDISNLARGNTNQQINLSDWDVRYLAGKEKGTIKLSDAYSKPAPGSRTYSTPGTYTFLVPPFVTLTVDVIGGSGGGGGGSDHFPYLYCWGGGPGTSGGTSRFGSTVPVVGPGGAGASQGGCYGYGVGDLDAADSVGTGGDTNTTGHTGGSRGHGSGPGGVYSDGGQGGDSGRAIKEWTHLITDNTPVWKSNVTVTVGSAGVGGYRGSQWCTNGGNGTAGSVTIEWE